MPKEHGAISMVINLIWTVMWCAISGCIVLPGSDIPVTDGNVMAGLSPYNWIGHDGVICGVVNGSSFTVGFKGTRRVALLVKTDHMTAKSPTRFPIIAWSVNGGPVQTHQLVSGEASIALAADVPDPVIDCYIKGMSPFEDRWTGDIPKNSLVVTGFSLDDGGVAVAAKMPTGIWLNIGDSIMSGDGAAYRAGQGRPPNDAWAASEDGRASYGYLLARHYGYRESRIAYGGYNWGGGMAKTPALTTLIDWKTSTIGRLRGDVLEPSPEVVLINLGENGVPPEPLVAKALTKIRDRVGKAARIIVMVPVSGRGKDRITQAFNGYKATSKDACAFLVDLGRIAFDTCDGQHPTMAGHTAIFHAALSACDAILAGRGKPVQP